MAFCVPPPTMSAAVRVAPCTSTLMSATVSPLLSTVTVVLPPAKARWKVLVPPTSVKSSLSVPETKPLITSWLAAMLSLTSR